MCSHFPTDPPAVRHDPVGRSPGGAVRGGLWGLRRDAAGSGRTKSKAYGRVTPAPSREWSSGWTAQEALLRPEKARFPSCDMHHIGGV